MPKKVPYLPEEQIERDAAALLAEYAQARGVVIAPPIPIEDIVEKHLKLGIEFDDMHRLLNHPRSVSVSIPTSSGRFSLMIAASSSTRASTPRRTRRRKAAIASRWRTRAAGIGGCTVICSPRTRRRSPCSTSRPLPRSSAVRARRKNLSSGRRISMRRAC